MFCSSVLWYVLLHACGCLPPTPNPNLSKTSLLTQSLTLTLILILTLISVAAPSSLLALIAKAVAEVPAPQVSSRIERLCGIIKRCLYRLCMCHSAQPILCILTQP